MRQSPVLWMSLASLALAAGLYGCETPEAFHISGDGGLLASGTGGVDTTPAGGHVGTGGIPAPASGGAVGTGGFMLATGGTTLPATGGAGGRASTGGIAGGGHAGSSSGSGGTGGQGTGGAAAAGGAHAGGSVGTGGRAVGGSVGTGGTAPGTGGSGNIGAGGRGAAGGSPGVGGSAGGAVGTGPCAGLCTPATDFKFSSGTTYQSPNLGTTAVCYQVATTLTIQGGGCSNCTVSSPARTVKINGTTAANNGAWSALPAKVNGGYCIQITAGAPDYTQFYTF